MALGDDLLLRIDGDSSSAEAALERTNSALSKHQAKLASVAAMAAKLEHEIEGAYADEARAAEVAAAKERAAAEQRSQAYSKAGTAMLVTGGVIAAGFALSANAAIKWETAWAGVTKTVDGSAEEMAELEDGLRNLAKTLPASHAEIAGVAEAAGQLGVQRESLLAFTKTMIDLGVSTNLSAEEAATGIAQMMNVMQSAPDAVDNLGAALVALGNNGASTEADILEMSTRLAAAGQQAGLTEADVLSFANALASVGVEAEAGGTAFSKVFTSIHDAVLDGSDDLTIFAQVAGVTADEFARAYGQDAAGAVEMFIEGLGRISSSGQSTTQVLDDLGFSDARLSRSLLSVAGAGDLLNESLDTGNQAWEDNTALVNEAAKRYETTASKIQIAKNGIQDAAITVGEDLLPAIQAMTEKVADAAEWFGNLPDPVRQSVEALGGLGAALLLGGGAWLKMTASAKTALTTLEAAPGTIRAVTLAMKGLGLAGAAIGTAFVIPSFVKWLETLGGARKETSGFAADLVRLGGAGKVTGDVLANFGHSLEQINHDLQVQEDTGNSWLANLHDWMNDTFSPELDRIHDLDKALAELVNNGNAEYAAKAFRYFADAAEKGGMSLDDFKARFPGYQEAIENARIAQEIANQGMRDVPKAVAGVTSGYHDVAEEADKLSIAQHHLATAFGIAGDEASTLDPEILTLATSLGISAGEASLMADASSTLNDELEALRDSAFAAQEAQDAFQGMLNEVQQAFEQAKADGDEFVTTLDGTSDAALQNRDTVRGMVDALIASAEQMAAHNGTTQEVTDSIIANRKALEDQLVAVGYNADEVAAFTQILDNVPGLVETIFKSVDVQRAKQDAKELEKQAAATKGPWEAKFSADTGQARLATLELGDAIDVVVHKQYVAEPTLSTGAALDKLADLGGALDETVNAEYVAVPKVDEKPVDRALERLGGDLDVWANREYTAVPKLDELPTIESLRYLGGELDEWANGAYTATPKLYEQPVKDSLRTLGGAMDEWANGEYTAIPKIDSADAKAALSDLVDDVDQFVNGSYRATVYVDVDWSFADEFGQDNPYKPPQGKDGSGSFGSQSYDEGGSYGGRFGQQSTLERAAMAGTRSAQVGDGGASERMAQQFAVAMSGGSGGSGAGGRSAPLIGVLNQHYPINEHGSDGIGKALDMAHSLA